MTRTPGQVGRAEAALTEAGAADAGSAVVTTVAADIPASNTAAAGTATRERMAYLLAPSQEWIGFRRHVNRVFQRKTRKSTENATTRKFPAITAILHLRESHLTASSRGCPGAPRRRPREPARRRKHARRLRPSRPTHGRHTFSTREYDPRPRRNARAIPHRSPLAADGRPRRSAR